MFYKVLAIRTRQLFWSTLSVSGTLVCALLLVSCSESANDADATKKKKNKTHIVEVMRASTQPVSSTTVRTGSLQAQNQVKIFNQEEGRITTVSYYESDPVKKGDILVKFDDTILRAEWDKAKANRLQAEQDFNRIKQLVNKGLSAEDTRARAATELKVAQAEESLLRTRLNYTIIRAPFSGIIAQRLVEPGDVVPKYSHLFTLIDPKSLYTQVSVSELYLPHLQVGDPVEVGIDALGREPLTGTIQRIHPTIDKRTRQGFIEIALNPVPDRARAGQLCRVTLTTPPQPRFLVPFVSLRRNKDGQYIYTVTQDNKAAIVYVHTGLQLANQIEILSPPADGTRVVTKGFIDLQDGMPVKIVNPDHHDSET